MILNWIILAVVVPLVHTARVQLIDLTPEEAQKLITQQSLDLRYATKLSEGPANGRSYNGKIIDSDDFTEEIYDANQFHGQDGLGRAIFGYTDNLQSRLEARNANGEVRGQYQYIDPWGKDVQVQYWVDSLGFHQTDNIPKYDLQPVTDTPEVKKAREEHERLWKEAARLNGIDTDRSDFYGANADKLENENDNGDQELEGQVSNQHTSFLRYPVLPYSQHIAPENAKTFGKVVDDSVIVDTVEEVRNRFARQQRNEVEEVTSEPRGFFYSFDYQAPFIVDRKALSYNPETQASEQISKVLEAPIVVADVDTFASDLETHSSYSDSSVNDGFEDDQKPRVSENIRDKITPEDEVHDVQTSPKQEASAANGRSNYLKADEPLKLPAKASFEQKVKSRGSIKFSVKSK